MMPSASDSGWSSKVSGLDNCHLEQAKQRRADVVSRRLERDLYNIPNLRKDGGRNRRQISRSRAVVARP